MTFLDGTFSWTVKLTVEKEEMSLAEDFSLLVSAIIFQDVSKGKGADSFDFLIQIRVGSA